ncbi:CHAD domain-containing protein [Pseudomonas laurentiana]|uniref:CHAD domain-containing protein n=1 Tax=Pseudomonas laurentiana TaxID=2364649 RepID=A0A6I5RLU6_9PSED|nr:CHAD domain-containing protein [Pseudomonas laurentiana]NES08635.1 CHAD domain-containing protein [Pseudomonas laurentiana]GGU74312.1 CHAD domain-containing protein [Pseudomonas laurentiana]
MAAMLDHVIAQMLSLQVRLMACQARLEANTDSEALHDLRIGVRRLRSLLRPLRGLPGVDHLEHAAGRLGELTTPLRDREVLAAQLLERGQHAAAQRRLDKEGEAFAQVAVSAELQRLQAIIDAFPVFLRAAQRQKLTRRLSQRIDKRLGTQWKGLHKALKDPAHDRHRLRLLVKRVRYGAEAYPQLERLTDRLQQQLKCVQGDLGDWHDLVQWLLQAEQQRDLMPCVGHWQSQLREAEARADRSLAQLQADIERR